MKIRWKEFIKNETVFFIALIVALLSMFIVKPNKEYFGYINYSVLVILFCLMGVVAGFQKIGLFQLLSIKLLSKTKNEKILGILLVLICFTTAMLITNDVALITFVPFTIQLMGNEEDNLIFIIVMETIAANLGSMMTPIGNPQNLFIYSYYHLNIFEFFKTMLPIGGISIILLFIILLSRKKSNHLLPVIEQETIKINKSQLIKYTFLFLICLLTVLRFIPYQICFGIVFTVLLLTDLKIFYKIDYVLLLTFICFFIFVGNFSSLTNVQNMIAHSMKGKEIFVSAFISQIISNVPAAIMLSSFTSKAFCLLQGVNIGGLGTIIASMASLISYKYYAMLKQARKGRYLIVFSMYNFSIFLFLLFMANLFGE